MRTTPTFTVASSRAAATTLLALGLVGCAGNSPSQSAAPKSTEPPTIEVAHVVKRPVDVTLSMPGELYSYETVAVYPRVTGFVKTMKVDRGSHVRAGDVLVELEAPELVAQRAEAQSKLQSAQAQMAAIDAKADADTSTYDKLKAASATPGVVAGNDLVVAQKAVEADQHQGVAAQQTVEAARQALQAITQMEGYLRVVAPFDGVITERNVHPGALVGPNSGADSGMPMLRLAQNDRLRLIVPVPEAYIAALRAGATISFTVPTYPGRTFIGKLARAAHDVDVHTRTMPVELDVVNRDDSLAPGTFCQVQWQVYRPDPSLFVPASSIASTTDRVFVIRVRDGKTEWIDVRTGLTAGSLTEVFGDLRVGDAVAAHGTDELRSGVGVRSVDIKPAT